MCVCEQPWSVCMVEVHMPKTILSGFYHACVVFYSRVHARLAIKFLHRHDWVKEHVSKSLVSTCRHDTVK